MAILMQLPYQIFTGRNGSAPRAAVACSANALQELQGRRNKPISFKTLQLGFCASRIFCGKMPLVCDLHLRR
jgi:hypothetical protein